MGGRLAHLVKSMDLHSIECRFDRHCQRDVVFWYRPLLSPSLQIARAGLDHHGQKVEAQPLDKGQDHSMVVEDAPLSSQDE